MFVGLVVALLSTGILLLFWLLALLDCDSGNNTGSLELLFVESEVVALLLLPLLENPIEGTMGGKDPKMLLVFDGGADSCCC